MVALIVILVPPLLIAFLLVMERVEEPLRRPTSQREVEDFLGTATEAEVGTLAHSGIRRARRVRPSGLSSGSNGETPSRAARPGRRGGAGRV